MTTGSRDKGALRVETARRILEEESQAIRDLLPRIDTTFAEAVGAILNNPGKIAVTGIGKSGHIARKVSATFSSTGTPAFFLHPGEALHGDLGMLESRDILLAFSKSGETEEILALLPLLERLEIPVIAIVGNRKSTIAQKAAWALSAEVSHESGPLGIAPTSSTTAMLAMGDALAMTVLSERDFGIPDFASLHPGGSLGRRYFLQIGALMHTGDRIPKVSPETPLRDVIVEMTAKKLGMTTVIDSRGILMGILTDGDLRRALDRSGSSAPSILDIPAQSVMTTTPVTLDPSTLASEALTLMETRQITSVVVVHADRTVVGVLHIHDLLRAGVL
ncbi:MAG: KpsF/GutQ family sugar-phosphate isomerase [Leptospirillia bacterium]